MVLLDDGSTPLAPTMANIRGAIAWLVEGAAAGDALFFQYSGHGGRIQGSDGFHETLCPLDMASEGQLLDTELFETLVAPLPSGCRLTVILDSCHSAGALNLPFLFTGTEGNLKSALAGEAVQMAMSRNWLRDVSMWSEGNPTELLSDVASMGLGLWDIYSRHKASQGASGTGFATDEESTVGLAVGEVIAITGCRSDQTSADVGNVDLQFDLQPTARSGAGGALTSAFIEALDGREAAPSYLELLEAIRLKLAEEGFTQVPQLASPLLVDLTSAFSMLEVCLPAAAGSRAAGDESGDGGPAAGFMAALAAAPMGMQMMQAVTLPDAGALAAGLGALGVSAGATDSLASRGVSDADAGGGWGGRLFDGLTSFIGGRAGSAGFGAEAGEEELEEELEEEEEEEEEEEGEEEEGQEKQEKEEEEKEE